MARREFSEAEKNRFAAERRELLEEWQAKLTGKVTDLVNGDRWQAWLDVASRFSSYSFRNSVLIMMQRPDATAVAGYRAWQTSFGRQANRGETGIKILAPVTRRVEKTMVDGRPMLDEHGLPVKATQLVGVRLTTVFDISQTSGPDLPAQPEPLLLRGEAPPGLWDSLRQVVEGEGFRVSRGDCDGANGWTDFATSEVRVRSDIEDAAAVKTLAHEAAHVLLHSTAGLTGEQVCRGRREVEAESVALTLIWTEFIVFARLGWTRIVQRWVAMKVQVVSGATGREVRLVDDAGRAVEVATGDLDYLGARGCSPNTVRGYAYDLLHLWRFLGDADLELGSVAAPIVDGAC